MVGKDSRNGCLKKSALPELSRACEKDSSPLKAEIQAVSGQAGTQFSDGMKVTVALDLGTWLEESLSGIGLSGGVLPGALSYDTKELLEQLLILAVAGCGLLREQVQKIQEST